METPMNVRRFVLRLAVGLLCFAVGWASAVLLGATRGAHTSTPRQVRTELILVPHFEAPPPPRFEMPPLGPSCRGKFRARHAHEWHDVPRVEEFELRFEAPPLPPPKPRRADR
jgi:hypothetical protein